MTEINGEQGSKVIHISDRLYPLSFRDWLLDIQGKLPKKEVKRNNEN